MIKLLQSIGTAIALAMSLGAPSFAEQSPTDIVKEYVDVVINGRQIDRIDEFIAEDLIQRNPNLPNGREPLREFWTGMTTANPEFNVDVVRIISEGDLVVEHSVARLKAGDVGFAVVDIYRVEDGLIVEHWDVLQEMPEETASGNHMVYDQ